MGAKVFATLICPHFAEARRARQHGSGRPEDTNICQHRCIGSDALMKGSISEGLRRVAIENLMSTKPATRTSSPNEEGANVNRCCSALVRQDCVPVWT